MMDVLAVFVVMLLVVIIAVGVFGLVISAIDFWDEHDRLDWHD